MPWPGTTGCWLPALAACSQPRALGTALAALVVESPTWRVLRQWNPPTQTFLSTVSVPHCIRPPKPRLISPHRNHPGTAPLFDRTSDPPHDSSRFELFLAINARRLPSMRPPCTLRFVPLSPPTRHSAPRQASVLAAAGGCLLSDAYLLPNQQARHSHCPAGRAELSSASI